MSRSGEEFVPRTRRIALLDVILPAAMAAVVALGSGWIVFAWRRRVGRGLGLRSGGRSAPSKESTPARTGDLFEALPAAVLVVAPAGRRVLAANDSARNWLGRREQIGRASCRERV